MKGKKTMEINPTSPVILDLKAKQAAGDDRAKATAELLFDTALLTSGACHAVTCDRTQTPNYHAITNRSTPFVHTAQVSTSTNPRRSRLRSSTSWARLSATSPPLMPMSAAAGSCLLRSPRRRRPSRNPSTRRLSNCPYEITGSKKNV